MVNNTPFFPVEHPKTTATYVFDGIEVKYTGRMAEKKLTRSSNNRLKYLYEVTPVDSSLGNWTKWVRFDDLYEVTG